MSQRTDIIDDFRKYSSIGESPLLNGIRELPYSPCWHELPPRNPVKRTLGA